MRNERFVNKLGWKLSTVGDFEIDQYDNPTAHYVVVEHSNSVIGGARVCSMNSKFAGHSYMLKDASLGRIQSIPKWIYPEVRESGIFWEGSRLVLSPECSRAADRLRCLSLILEGLSSTIKLRGGEFLLSLSPTPLARSVSLLGYRPVRIGPSYMCSDDGREYAVFQLTISELENKQKLHE